VYNEEVRDLLAAPGSPARPLEVSALAAGALPPGARPRWLAACARIRAGCARFRD
jgi:hypothetical protein